MLICDISVFNRYGKQHLDELLKPLNLDWRDLVAILVINEVPGITQAKLNPFLQTDKANITKLLQSLETRSLIRRNEDKADHRSKVCFLTEAGSAQVKELYHIMEQWESLCFTGLSDQERQEYDRLSQIITQNMVGAWPKAQ